MDTVEPSVFRQVCPGCQRELELPSAADSKTAQCPACGHQFVAKAESSKGEASPRQTIPQDVVAPPRLKVVSIETVVQRTQLSFARRRKRLITASIWPFSILFLLVAIPILYLSELYVTNAPLAMRWLWGLSPAFTSLVIYACWFALKRADWVCDLDTDSLQEQKGKRVPRQLWIPDRSLLKVAGVFFVLIVFVPLALGIAFTVASQLLGSMFAGQAVELAMVLSLVVALVLSGSYGWLLARLWPMFPLALGFGSPISDSRLAWRMTSINQLTSFLTVVLTSLLLGVGFGLLCAPLLVTAPAAALLLVVAHREMTGTVIPLLDNVVDEFDRFEA